MMMISHCYHGQQNYYKFVLTVWMFAHISHIWKLFSIAPRHLSAPLFQHDRKDLECVCVLVRAKVWLGLKWICTWWLCQTSIHLPLPHPAANPNLSDRQTGGRHARGQHGSGGGGWAILIQCLLYLQREQRGGQRRFSYKANSGPISSHVLSGDNFFLTFSPFSFPLTLCIAFILSFIFILLRQKKKGKKKKKQGRQRLSSQQSTERGGGTDSSPEDRPESRDIPQCSW